MSIYLGKKKIINSNAKEIYKGNQLVYPVNTGYPNDGNWYADDIAVYWDGYDSVKLESTIINGYRMWKIPAGTQTTYHDRYCKFYIRVLLKTPINAAPYDRGYFSFSVYPSADIEFIYPSKKKPWKEVEVNFGICQGASPNEKDNGMTWSNVVTTGTRRGINFTGPVNGFYGVSGFIGSSWNDAEPSQLTNINGFSFSINPAEKMFNSTTKTGSVKEFYIGSFAVSTKGYFEGTAAGGGLSGTLPVE